MDNLGIDFAIESLTFNKISNETYICSNKTFFHLFDGNELIPISFPVFPISDKYNISYKKVLKDRNGIYWIATSGTYGLLRWDGYNIEQLLMNSVSESIIEDINFDDYLNIIGINYSGYFYIDVSSSNITQFDYNLVSGVIGRALTAIHASDGNLWFGGTCPLSMRNESVSPPVFTRFSNALMPGPFINTFYSSPKGWTFLANYNGLGIYNTHSFKFFDSASHSKIITGIGDLATNSENELYLVAYNQIYKFSENSLQNIFEDKLKSYQFYGLTFDSADTLWFTSRKFIWKYFENSLDSIPIPGKEDNYLFTGIKIDKNNTKWIKTLNGFYAYKDNKWVDSIKIDNIPVKIRTFEDLKMYIDNKGDIWLSSIDVLFKYDSQKWTMLTSGIVGVPSFGSLLEKVPTLSFVPESKMYLCIDEKVFLKDGNKWKLPGELNPVYEKATKLFADINDNKWIYKSDNNSIAITLFRENGVYNDFPEETMNNNTYLAVYPNPASDYIIISSDNTSLNDEIENNLPVKIKSGKIPESTIQIFDIFGKCVLSVDTALKPVFAKLNISELTAGVYFVRFSNEKPVKFIKI